MHFSGMDTRTCEGTDETDRHHQAHGQRTAMHDESCTLHVASVRWRHTAADRHDVGDMMGYSETQCRTGCDRYAAGTPEGTTGIGYVRVQDTML